ncbi:hypothetical protein AAFF_G00320930 [Aldrovandia affinis]|uniref:BTB domain-containing protein n=1 Tax=Aldrovandia affinis TaxID=143900 RepID=A0AAD7R7D9_9TELE|nr:hypothetical protein AAFF_G00320930 [Aldrovandia affinis]
MQPRRRPNLKVLPKLGEKRSMVRSRVRGNSWIAGQPARPSITVRLRRRTRANRVFTPRALLPRQLCPRKPPRVASAPSADGGATGGGAGGLGLGQCPNGDANLRVKEKVVLRMQKFRRVSPQKLTHVEDEQPRRTALGTADATLLPASAQAVDPLQGPLGDQALALRLQEEMDREAQGREEMVDLEQGGLFFCQICQRDLSVMSPLHRTQHINRCLDKSEGSGPPPPPPAVPECPMCGKRFKSQKSRAAHLKRCSAELGVAPALLLQAVQRQATETASDCAAGPPTQAGGSKRKGSADPNRPPKKRQRKKAAPLDEDTMVALALSRSMEEQEREREREREALLAAPAAAAVSGLQWRPDAGKKRGKKKKGPHRPPSPPSPPGSGPRRRPQTAAGPSRRPPAPSAPPHAPDPGLPTQRPAGLDSPTEEQAVAPPSTECRSQGRGEAGLAPCPPRLGSQTLCDLMELAEEGMTLTQWGYAPNADPEPEPEPEPEPTQGASVTPLHLSGFVPERAPTAGSAKSTVALSRLTTDLSSMVNNPQLSDVQLQVDSGEVFLPTRSCCTPAAPCWYRWFMTLGDVPPGAAQALLQYLYTGRCPLSPALLPHVQELAVRFDLEELEQMCQHCPGGVAVEPWVEVQEQEEEQEQECGEQEFLELLRSIPPLREGDSVEERVDEDELLEIYQFAATQRKPESETETETEAEAKAVGQSGGEEEEEEEEEERGSTGTETEEKREDRGKGENTSLSRPCSDRSSSHRHPSLDVFPAGPAADRVTEEGSEQAGPTADHVTEEGSEQAGHAAGHVTEEGSEQAGPGGDASLDRSYDCLFSKSWGEHTSPSQEGASTELHSSRREAVVIDLSISPPLHCVPALGPSPLRPRAPEERALSRRDVKRESQGCTQVSPRWPELIVLSDSGEEQDVDVPRDLHTDCDTEAGAGQNQGAVDRGPVDCSPVDGGPKDRDLVDSSPADSSPADGGPEDSCIEMSWLIPGTPEPPARPMRVNSTQTYCSMRPTQLFARPRTSSSSSSSSSSLPPLSGQHLRRLHACPAA